MPVAVLNVRPTRQRSLDRVRMDNRNKRLALASVGARVLLYAPRDEPRHGYFATAVLTDVIPDMTQRRFMFLKLEDVARFTHCIPLEALAAPIESRAYRHDGSLDFSHFSPSIRALLPEDQIAALALANQNGAIDGFQMPQAPALHHRDAPPPARRGRVAILRNVQLRWSVLQAYGTACAVCGDDNSIHAIGAHEVEVCHLRALAHGGPDELTNAMPMCRTHRWFYDRGGFTLADAGGIILSSLAPPALRRQLHGRQAARFPNAVQAWPRAEHLQFHRDHVFLG
ncbi:hypothetical protein GGR20_003523 [Devosia subaequoris]|uniref:HNH endonuclease n=1 Tax=Devosia subaequoris TaxID=395930 RepID=A0A7W6IRG5_9HYPH|nr:HNH endonuclease [Devosia subaequoris]MBB4053856.1 hypothetical protein [Devosia subaequoris]MCP1211125.1 hypothetical protein [Devosia subaequoris]